MALGKLSESLGVLSSSIIFSISAQCYTTSDRSSDLWCDLRQMIYGVGSRFERGEARRTSMQTRSESLIKLKREHKNRSSATCHMICHALQNFHKWGIYWAGPHRVSIYLSCHVSETCISILVTPEVQSSSIDPSPRIFNASLPSLRHSISSNNTSLFPFKFSAGSGMW